MDAEGAASDVQEMHPWDPHKAAKDVEVGDFYFKRKNYHAALERYKEALIYKPNDALANFRLAECLEKTGNAGRGANSLSGVSEDPAAWAAGAGRGKGAGAAEGGLVKGKQPAHEA